LEVVRHLRNLVQQQRAAGRRFNQSAFVPIGAGESAFAVTKQLGFDQFVRDGGAVDARERQLRARTLKVKRGGNQLLARAGLAFYQDRSVRRRGSADDVVDLLHLRVTSDDSEVVAISSQRTLQTAVLTFDRFELQRSFDQGDDLMRRERFLDEVKSAALDGFDRNVQRAVRGHHNDFRVRACRL
jgi:hypothetical protein